MAWNLRPSEVVLPVIAAAIGTCMMWLEIAWFKSASVGDYLFSAALAFALVLAVFVLAEGLVRRLGTTPVRRAAVAIFVAPVAGLGVWWGLHLLSMVPIDRQRHVWTEVWALALNKLAGNLAVGGLILFAAVVLMRWRYRAVSDDVRIGRDGEA